MKNEITPPVPAESTTKTVPTKAPKMTPAATQVADAAPGITANVVTIALNMKKLIGFDIFGIISSFNDSFCDPCVIIITDITNIVNNDNPLTHNSIGIICFRLLFKLLLLSNKTFFVCCCFCFSC